MANLPKSVQHNGRTINFSFHNGALAYMREEKYEIDYNKNPFEGHESKLDVFLTTFLLCAAKFYARKEPSFEYDINDAYDWMDLLGGFPVVVQLFNETLAGKMILPDNIIAPPEPAVKKK